MRRGYFIFFITLCLTAICYTAYSQSIYDTIFHRTYAERSYLFDDLVFNSINKLNTRQADSMLDMLEKQAKKEGDYTIELELILARYNYYDLRELTNFDKKIAHMKELLKTVAYDKYPEYHVLFMMELGNNYLGKKHNNVAAFEYYFSAYNIARNFSSEEFPDKKWVYTTIGNAYYRIGDYENAKYMLQKADTVAGRRDMAPIDYNCKNTLGLAYRVLGDYDSAIYYFKDAYKLAEKEGDSVWVGITNGNIGITYYIQGSYEKAIPLLKKDIAACIKEGSTAYDNAVNSMMVLADIYMLQHNLTGVAENLRLAEIFLPQARNKVPLYSKYYPVKAKYAYAIGNLRAAYQYQDSAIIYTDSIYTVRKAYEISKLQIKYETIKNTAELKQLKAEKKYMEFVRNGLICGVFLSFVIGLLFINRQRLRHKLKQNQLLAQQKTAERDLKNASKELESFTKHLQDKNALIEKSTREIERLQNTLDNTRNTNDKNDVLQQIHAATILTDAEWEEFKAMFEQVHKGYLLRLKEKMPDLTPADTRFIVLSRLKMSNKEMAGIMGVQADSIRTYKYRLRKKYDLPDDDSLYNFVQSI